MGAPPAMPWLGSEAAMPLERALLVLPPTPGRRSVFAKSKSCGDPVTAALDNLRPGIADPLCEDERVGRLKRGQHTKLAEVREIRLTCPSEGPSHR